MSQQKKLSLKFIIFSTIGIFNTVFDLTLYVLIYNLSSSIIVANLVATSAALCGSYFLNSRITFKSKKWTTKSFVQFIIVTLIGLWIFQTGFIVIATPTFKHIATHIWQHSGGTLERTVITIAPKVVAVGITFVWNFLWYNKVIFKDDENHLEESIRAAEF